MSCAKVLYYYADWWLGLVTQVLPVTWRGGLVVFDRDFSDLEPLKAVRDESSLAVEHTSARRIA